MSNVLATRKVSMFRCHIDPAIGPTPKLAFSLSDPLLTAIGLEVELTQVGIYAKWYDRRNKDKLHEHLVPFANIQSIKLEPAQEKIYIPANLANLANDETIENNVGEVIKRRPGRPKAEIA